MPKAKDRTRPSDTSQSPEGQNAGAGSHLRSGAQTGVLAAAALAGAAVGVAANYGRKLLVQGLGAAAGGWDEALMAEHTAMLALFDKILALQDYQLAMREALLAKLEFALASHAMQEENVIYPALRQAGLVDEADALTTEHGYVKTYLYELKNMTKSSGEWLVRVRDFRSMLEVHMRIEEKTIFPALRKAFSPEENARLTKLMLRETLKLNSSSPVGTPVKRTPQRAQDSDLIVGKGVGRLVHVGVGRATLNRSTTDDLSTDWARSTLLGAAEMAGELGISPATLANWRREGRVIAFKRDLRNYHYPRRQVYRGAVVEGLAAVVRHFDQIEDAWEWLVTPNGHTQGLPPIDRLRLRAQEEVERAAEGALDFT
jgi:hemerythrin-like domain-containing protein